VDLAQVGFDRWGQPELGGQRRRGLHGAAQRGDVEGVDTRANGLEISPAVRGPYLDPAVAVRIVLSTATALVWPNALAYVDESVQTAKAARSAWISGQVPLVILLIQLDCARRENSSVSTRRKSQRKR
jgi:hypothetical protein